MFFHKFQVPSVSVTNSTIEYLSMKFVLNLHSDAGSSMVTLHSELSYTKVHIPSHDTY